MSNALLSGFIAPDGITAPCALRSVDAHAKISLGQAMTTITQHYENMTETAVEAIYRFPLPYDAVVTKFSARIGEAEVVGKLFERKKAQKRYQKALKDGDSAMLLENNDPDVFDIAVSNIAPGEDAAVTIEYWQSLKAVDQSCRYALPTALAPRYLPQDKRKLAESILPNLGEADYRLTFTAELDLGDDYAGLTSPSHDIVVDTVAALPTITLASPTLLDSDLILDIALHNESDDSYIAEEGLDGNFLSLKFTVEAEHHREVEPREYIFLLDASGSMAGGKLTQAKRALSLCLRNLLDGDRFNLIAFGSSYKSFAPQSMVYNQQNLDEAEAWLKAVGSLGGTEIYRPLKHIFSTREFDMPREVLLFTDGQVGNERDIIELVKDNADNTRLFPFGIDTAINRSFIDGLAKAGGGQPEYIYPGERIDDKVLRQFARIGEPVLTDLRIEGTSGDGVINLQNAAPATGFPKTLSTNEEVDFCFSLGFRPIPTMITVTGDIDGQAYSKEIALSHKIDWQGLSKRWAKERIDFLQNRSERSYIGKLDGWAKEAVDVSLQYGVISTYTAYLAQIKRKDKLTGKPRTEIVHSALPSLWEEDDGSPMLMMGSFMPSVAEMSSVSMSLVKESKSSSAFFAFRFDQDDFVEDSGSVAKTAALKQKANGSLGDVRKTAHFIIGMVLGGEYAPYRNQIKKAATWLLDNAADRDAVWALAALQAIVGKKLADAQKCAALVERLTPSLCDKDREQLAQVRAGQWHAVFGTEAKELPDDKALAQWVLGRV